MPFFRKPKPQEVLALPDPAASMTLAGQIANTIAQRGAFEEKQQRQAENTRRRYQWDLACFAAYLQTAGLVVGDLYSDPGAWRGVTWGMVKGFVQWQLQQGYAMRSVNVRLSTVRVFAGLAAQANVISAEELALIRTVQGFRRIEARNIDETRAQTRKGKKKIQATTLTRAQATALCTKQPDTPVGRRDALLMCLLLEHGLRCGEVAALEASALNLSTGLLVFYRRKVDKTQIHTLTPNTYRAAYNYVTKDRFAMPTKTSALMLACGKNGILLSGEKEVIRGGKKVQVALQMRERAINARVRELGARLGIQNLSPHDCRHHWATAAARGGTSLEDLREAGGWNNIEMPSQYIEEQQIANIKVKLADEM